MNTNIFRDVSPSSDLLLDRLVLGCQMEITDRPSGDVLRAALPRSGRLYQTIEVTCPLTGTMLNMPADFRLAELRGTPMIASGSSVEINATRWLRAQLGLAAPPTADSNDNVLTGELPPRPLLAGLQLSTVAHCLSVVTARFRGAVEPQGGGGFRIRAAELYRDIPVPDAPALALRIADEPCPWFRRWGRKWYRSTEHGRAYVSTTWMAERQDASIRLKFYAKTETLLRIEVVYDNARAVGITLPDARNGWLEPDEIAAQLAVLGEATVATLNRMEAFATGLGPVTSEAFDFLVGLGPLWRITGAPPRRRFGSPIGRQTVADARSALRSLLLRGRYEARNIRSNSTLRKKLDQLVREGVLVRDNEGRTPLYTLPPEATGARLALARGLLSAAVVPGEGG